MWYIFIDMPVAGKRSTFIKFLVFFGLLSAVCTGLVFGQNASQLPLESDNYVAVVGQTSAGAQDLVEVIFFEIPAAITGDLYFAVRGASQTNGLPDQDDNGGTTRFYIVGGSGAHMATASKQVSYADTSYLTGTPLSVFEVSSRQVLTGTDSDSGLTLQIPLDDTGAEYSTTPNSLPNNNTSWIYFPAIDASLGEEIGTKRYFKLVAVHSDTSGNDKNAFQVDVSLGSPAASPNEVPGAKSFSYSWTLNARTRTIDNVWSVYPFVPAGTSSDIGFYNYDADNQGTLVWQNIDNSRDGSVTVSGNGTAANTDVSIDDDSAAGYGSDTKGTWLYRMTEAGGGTDPNPLEFWVLNDGEPLKIYSSPVTVVPDPYKVVMRTSETSVTTGTPVTVNLQIVDNTGAPAEYRQNIYVLATGSIDNDSTIPWDGLDNSELITTDASGAASFTITDSDDGEDVTITLYTDGSNGSDDFGAGTDDTVTITFATDPIPVIESLGDTIVQESVASPSATLKKITITDQGAVNLADVDANDFSIRIDNAIGLDFVNAAPTITVYDSVGGVGTGVVASAGAVDNVFSFDITTDLAAGDYITIEGLQVDSNLVDVDSDQVYSLELDYNGDGVYDATDSRTITVTDANATTYTYVGTDGVWATATNWIPTSGPPADDDSVVVGASATTTTPLQLPATVSTLKNLTIQSSAVFNLNGNDLTVQTSFSNDGTLILQGAESVTLTADTDSGTVEHNGTGTYPAPLPLGSSYYDLTFSGTGEFSISSNLNVHDISLAAGVTLNIGANDIIISGSAELNGTVNGTGNIVFSANPFYITGDIITNNIPLSFNNPVILQADATIDTGSADITFNSGATINGNRNLTLTSSGNIYLNSVVGGSTALFSLTADGNGTVYSGADITTNGNTITFTNPVIITDPVTYTDHGTGIYFEDTLDGDGDNDLLTLTTTNDAISSIEFQDVVGTTPLGSLTVNNAFNFEVWNTLTVTNNIDQNDDGDSDPVLLYNDVTSTAGSIDFGSPVTLVQAGSNIITAGTTVNLGAVTDSAAIALLDINAGTGVTLSSVTLDGAGANAVDIDFDTSNSGAVTASLNGAIDGGAVTINGDGTNDIIDVNADITASGILTLGNASEIQLDASAARTLSSGGAMDLATNVTGVLLNNGDFTVTLDANGDSLLSVAAVSDDGAGATVAADLTLNSEGGVSHGAIDLNDGTDGDLSIVIDSNDNGTASYTLSGAITNIGSGSFSGGGTGTNDTLDINSGISTTVGALTIENFSAVTVAAVTLTGATDVAFSNNIGGIDLDAAGSVTVTGTGGSVNLGAVTDSAAIALLDINAGTAVTLSSVTLDGAGANAVDIDFDTSNSGAVTASLNGAIDGGAVTVNGDGTNDTIDVNADITASGILTLGNASEIQLDASAARTLSSGGVMDLATNVTGVLLNNGDFTVTLDANGDSLLSVAALADDASGASSASLTLNSEGGVSHDTINLDDVTDGTLIITVDSDDDETVTLVVDNKIQNIGIGSFSGGGTGTNDTIDINSNVTTTVGALTVANADIVDVSNVTLTAATNVVMSSNVAAIDLDAAGSVTVTGTGGSVSLGAVDDSANIAELELNAGTDITLSSVTLDNGGASLLDINLDTGSDSAAALSVTGAVSVASMTADGQGTNDSMSFSSTVASTGTTIGISTADTIAFIGDVTANTDLSISTVNTAVDLGANVDLTATGGAVAVNSSVTAIDLSGVGSNIITAGTTVNLGAVTDSAAIALLDINAGTGVTLSSVTLDGAGANAVDIDFDTSNSGAVTASLNGAIDGGAVTVNGDGTNDIIDVNADITASGILTLGNASEIQLDASAARTLSSGGAMDLATNVTGVLLNNGDFTVTLDANGDSLLSVAAVSDDGAGATVAADLTLNSEGGVSHGAIDLNDGTDGDLSIVIDSNDNGTASYTLSGAITNIGSGSFSGGGTGTNDTLDINSGISTTVGALTIENFSAVTVAAVTLTGATDVAFSNNIGGIDLDAAGSVTVTGTGGSVNLGAVDDSSNIAELEVNAGTDITLSSVTLDNGGASLLDINLDTGADSAAALSVTGAVSVASMTADGQGTNDSMSFGSTVASTGTTIGISTADTIAFIGDITANTDLSISTVNTAVDLGANVDLTATGGAVAVNSSVTAIDLSGVGSNIITAGTTVNLGAVTDSAAIALLDINAGTAVTLSSVTLDGAGANAVDIDFDTSNSGAVTASLNGAIDGGAVTVNGDGTNDIIDVNADITASGILTLGNASEIQLDASAARTLSSGGVMDLATNVTGVLLNNGDFTVTLDANGDSLLSVAAVSDDGAGATVAADLTLNSEGGVSHGAIDLNDGTDGDLSIVIDSNDNGTASYTLSGAITNIGSGSFSGGGTGTNDTLDINSGISTTVGALTIENFSAVTVAAVTLTGATDVAFSNNIGGIDLDAAGSVTVTGTGGSVNLGAVDDSSNIAELEVNAGTDITLTSVTLDNGGASLLDINLDTGADSAAALSVTGAVSVASMTADGQGTNDSMSFGSTVASTGTTIGISTADTIAFIGDITANTDLSISTVNTAVDLGANVDLTATGGAVAVNSSVTAIDLSGVGSNIITAGTTVNLGAVDDSANIAELEVNAGTDITLTSVTLDNGGASLLDINLDTGADSAAALSVTGAVSVASMTADGQGTNDSMSFGSTVASTGTTIGISTADTIAFIGDVTANTDLSISTVNTAVDLGANVDLTATGGAVAVNSSVTAIDLSGIGSNIITAGTTVNLGAVDDSANIAELEVNAGTDITLTSVTLDNGGASLLDINLDTGADSAAALSVTGAVSVASITADGQGINDSMSFGSTVASTGTTIGISTADTIAFIGDVTANTDLSISTVNTAVDLGANVDLTATGGAVAVNSSVTAIDLSGVGSNIITAGTTVNLGAVTDSAAIALLDINAGTGVTLSSVTLDGAGANAVDIDFDTSNSGAVTASLNGAIDGGAVTINGDGTNDIIDVNADITASGILTLGNASEIQLDASAARTLSSGGAMDLATNVTGVLLNNGDFTVTLDANGDALLSVAALADDASGASSASLTLNSEGGVSHDTINLDDVTDGTLIITVDSDDDETVTLVVDNKIQNIGSGSFSGGGTGTNDTIDINSNVTTTVGALTVANADIVDVSNVTLTAATNVVMSSNVAAIDLDAAGSVTVTGTGGSVSLGAVDDSANIAELELNAGTDITLSSVTLDNGGASLLDINLDTGSDSAAALSVTGAVSVASMTADGQGTNDSMSFGSTVASTGTTIGISTADTIAFIGDVTANTDLSISTVNTAVDLGANVDLTATGGAVAVNSSVTAIDLSGVGSNIITAGTTVNLGAVDDSAAIALLDINAGTGVTLSSVTLDGAGANAVDIDFDTSNSGAVTASLNGAIDGGAVTVNGDGTNDIIDVNADITASGILTLGNTSEIQLDASAARTLSSGGAMDLATNVTGVLLNNGDFTVTLDTNGDALLSLAALTDDGAGATAADLTLNSEGGVSHGAIDLNDGTDGDLSIVIDSNDNGTASYTLSGAITNIGSGSFSGGGTGTNDTLDINSGISTTAGALTIENFSAVTVAAVTLTGATDVAFSNNIGGIDLDAAGSVTVTGTGGSVNLGAVDDSANIAELEVNAGTDITLSSVTLDNGGASLLDINLDTGVDSAAALSVTGAVSVASMTADGQGTNDSMSFGSTVASTGTTIGISTADTIAFIGDITANTDLSISTVNTAVDLGANVDLTATGGAVAVNSSVTAIDLSGVGSNIITAGTTVNLGAVTDSAAIALLDINAGTAVTLSSVTLDGAGANAVDIDFDTSNSGAVTASLNGAIDGGAVTVNGDGTNDTIDVNADITASGILTLGNASEIQLDASAARSLSSGGAMDLATNVTGVLLNNGDFTVTLDANGDSLLSVAALADDASGASSASLTLNSEGGVSHDTINLDDVTDGTLIITVDSDDDETVTLVVDNKIQNIGIGSFSGGGTGTNDTIDINSNVTTTVGALTVANADIVDVSNVTLTAATNVVMSSNIAAIDLDGAGSVTVTGTGGSVSLGAVDDSANIAELEVNAGTDITLTSVTLDNGGASLLDINLDTGADSAAALSVTGAVSVASMTADGQGTNDSMSFSSTVASTGTTIGISTADTIAFIGDVTANTDLSISTVNTAVDLGANVDLTATGGAVAVNSSVTAIDLSGIGSNIITAGTTVNLGAVDDSANIAELELNAGTDITLSSVTLDNGGASLLDINLDTGADSAAALSVTGAVSVASMTADGQGTNDSMSFSSTVASTGTTIGISTADTVAFIGDVTANTDLSISTVNTAVDLGANVDLTATGGAVAVNSGVTAIDLSGVGSNIITAGTTVNLGAVDDSANIAELEVNAGTDITLTSVTLDNGGASLLDINLDTGADSAAALSVTGAVSVASITADGQGINDSMSFGSTVTSTGTTIGISTADTVVLSGDVTAATNLSILNVNTSVDLGADVDLTATGGAVAVNSGVTAIDLSGVGSNIITAGTTVNLGAVDDSANIAELEVNAGTDITLTSVTLDNGGASLLDINLDTGVDSAAALSVTGAVSVASMTADGQGTNDSMSFGSTVASTGTTIGISTADTIAFIGDVTANTNLSISTVNTAVDLGANVDLTATGGSVAVNSSVTAIDLSGVGSNIITAGTTVNLGAVTDSAAIALLDINAGTGVTLSSVTLDGAGANAVDIDFDTSNSGAVTASLNGAIDGGAVTVNGDGTNDTIDVNADITASGILTLGNASEIQLDASAARTLSSVGAMDLATNVTGVLLNNGNFTVTLDANGDALLSVAAVSDDGAGATVAADLTLNSEGGVSHGAIDLNDGTDGDLIVTIDSDNDGTASYTLSGAITNIGIGSFSGGGTGTNDTIDINSNVTTTVGALTVANADIVDVSNVTLTAATNVVMSSNVAAIDLDGAGSVTVTGTGGSVSLGAVDDSANIVELELNAGTDITLTSVTLDNGGANLLDINLDTGADSAAALSVTGAVSVASMTADGQGTNDSAVFNNTLTAGSGGIDINADAITINNTVTTTGTIAGDGTVTITNSGLLDIASGADMSLYGAFTQNGTGVVETAGDIVTNNSNISFATAITVTDDESIVFDTGAAAGNLTFSSTINSEGDNTEILTLDAGTGTLTLNGAVGGTEPFGYVLLRGAGNCTSSGTIDISAQDVYIDANGYTLVLQKNLSTDNLIFYRGTLNINGNAITTGNDFVVFGNNYDPYDIDRASTDPVNTFFAYPPAAVGTGLAYKLGGSYDAAGAWGLAPNASFTDNTNFDLTDPTPLTTTISVGGNFYVNGCDMEGDADGTDGGWSLLVQDNSASDLFNDPNEPFGLPYAVAFNMNVSYCTSVTGGNISAAEPVDRSEPLNGNTLDPEDEQNNLVSDGGNNQEYVPSTQVGWDFIAPYIVSAEIVKDNIIRITFNEPMENSRDEISAMVSNGYTDHRGGAAAATDTAFAANTAYVDMDGTPDSLPFTWSDADDYAGDLTIFYVQTSGGLTWATDANGGSASVSGNGTDSSGTTATTLGTIPDLSWVKGTFYDAGGKNPVWNYTENSDATYETTLDDCGPVLYQIRYGRAAYDQATYYSAHNYFHLYWSEPVDLDAVAGSGFDTGAGADAENVRSELPFGAVGGWGGDIRYDSGKAKILVDGYFYYDAPNDSLMTRGARTGIDSSNSLFRLGNDQELRIYLSGYLAGAVGSDLFPGWHSNVPNPATAVNNSIEIINNPNIVDVLSNQIDYQIAPANLTPEPIVAGTVADAGAALPYDFSDGTVPYFNAWDVDPPCFSSYDNTSFEIVSRATTPTQLVNRLEFHILDNSSVDLSQAANPANPQADGHWDPENLSGNTVNGLTHPNERENEGIRDKTFDYFGSGTGEEYKAFKIEAAGVTPRVYTSNTGFDTAVGDTSLYNDVLPDINDSYFTLTMSDSGHSWGLLSDLEIEYDESRAYITDLAGNIIQSTVNAIAAIERTPPEINLSLCAVGMSTVYLTFSEPIWGDKDKTTDVDYDDFVISGNSPTGFTVLERSSAGNGSIDGVIEGILNLSSPLTANQALSLEILPSASDVIFDKAQNAMPSTKTHRITDVGIGVAEPVWASDSIHRDDVYGSGFSTLREFTGADGSKLMDSDITLEASILASSYIGLPVQLYYDVAPSDDVVTDEGFWLPSYVSIEFPTPNTDARSTNPTRTQGAVRDFLLPGADVEIEPGADLEFLLRVGDLYAARITDENDPRTLVPWVIPIRDIVRQAAGVSILNNVINPEQDEQTVLSYGLETAGNVVINVFNLGGDLVNVIFRGTQGVGNYVYTWDGTNRAGNIVARGIYFIRIVGPGIDEFRKVMIVK